jgi:hypothetical protein
MAEATVDATSQTFDFGSSSMGCTNLTPENALGAGYSRDLAIAST